MYKDIYPKKSWIGISVLGKIRIDEIKWISLKML